MNKNADVELDNEENETLLEQESDNEQDNSDGEEISEEEQDSEGDDSEGEGDDSEGNEGDEGDDEEEDGDDKEKIRNLKERLTRAHAQIDRLKGKKVESREKRNSKSSESDEGSVKVADKALMVAYGYKDKSDQVAISELARKAKMSISEALDDSFIIDRLEHMKKKELVRRAASRPDGKSKSGTKGVSFYIQRNIIPKDPEMASKVRAELARRSREGFS